MIELFDSHSHYNDEKFEEDRDDLLKQIYDFGVTKIIVAGYDVESSKKAIDLSKQYNFIYSICGISPNDIPENEEELEDMINEIKEVANNTKVVAIGEIGLDYHWNTENKELQKKAFVSQIKLANELNLPIVIHTRDAVVDTLTILKENIPTKKGVFHCCPLNQELVKEALKLDFYISLAGPITYKNSKNADEIINLIPMNRMLIETDCPYLSPEPHRGERNDSRNMIYQIEKISEVKGISKDKVAKETYENAKNIFNIK